MQYLKLEEDLVNCCVVGNLRSIDVKEMVDVVFKSSPKEKINKHKLLKDVEWFLTWDDGSIGTIISIWKYE